MEENRHQRWFRIWINDPQCISAASLQSLLGFILNLIPVSLVGIEQFEGIKQSATPDSLLEETFPILPLDVFQKQLKLYLQIIWGRFFFFKEDTAGFIAQTQTIEQNLANSEVAVCAFDNTAYVIFTRDRKFVDRLIVQYDSAGVLQGNLEKILALPEDI